MTNTATATPSAPSAPSAPDVVGDLVVNENAVGYELCIPTNQLVAGDTVIVSGLSSGNTRTVIEVRIIDGAAYINTCSGWYRYRKVYIHVTTTTPAQIGAAT